VELTLDCRQIRIDVGVVIFDVVDHQRARPVMQKLRALVEERRVVLVGLDHEGIAAAEPGRYAQIRRHATDQVSGVAPGLAQDPCHEAARGGLAMRTRHRDDMPGSQHLAREPFRPGTVGDTAVEQLFDHRDASGHHVADDHHIRRRLQLARRVALGHRDSERRQLIAHRGIYVPVAAGDTMARLARNSGHARHEGSADAEDMDVHQPAAGENCPDTW